ncbi:MAG: hypothetical protein ABFS56_08805 [Pseudomonadota bacterium]
MAGVEPNLNTLSQRCNDISPDFRCKKCGATKEVDHITRDENGNITKVVQTNNLNKTHTPTPIYRHPPHTYIKKSEQSHIDGQK